MATKIVLPRTAVDSPRSKWPKIVGSVNKGSLIC